MERRSQPLVLAGPGPRFREDNPGVALRSAPRAVGWHGPGIVREVRTVALFGLVAALALLAGCGGGDSSVTVPLVAGLKEPLAVQVLEEARLVPSIERVPDADARAGVVVSQSITEGSDVDEGATVTIAVATSAP